MNKYYLVSQGETNDVKITLFGKKGQDGDLP